MKKSQPKKRHLWALQNYFQNHRCPPYTPRYFWTRTQEIKRIKEILIENGGDWKSVVDKPRYAHFCERIPEYAWVLSHLLNTRFSGRFLDVGCVMNEETLLPSVLEKFQEVHFLNLISEPLVAHGRISYFSQDIRQNKLEKATYDIVTSISTLEHVGGDNSYNASINGSAEIQSNELRSDWFLGLKACLDLPKENGTLLVSLPYDSGNWHQGAYHLGNSDLKLIDKLCEERNKYLTIHLMANSKEGWISVHDRHAFDLIHERFSPGASRVVLLEITSRKS